MSNMFKTMCAEKANVLNEITLNQKQADLIAYRFSKHLKVKTPTVVFVDKLLRRKSGDYYKLNNRIRLFIGGMNLHTLLHEISHAVEFNHKPAFWYLFYRNIELWETKMSKDKDIVSSFKLPKKEKPMSATKKFKYVMEILEGEIFNKTLKMIKIGQTLADEGINNRENILKIQNILKKKGIRVTK